MLKTFPALAALAAATALVVPTVSRAAEQTSVRVYYSDLNLATESGKDVLQRRIAAAATQLCDVADSRNLEFARAVQECRATAIAGAEPAFKAAVASSRHES